jgi:hypothetical protein
LRYIVGGVNYQQYVAVQAGQLKFVVLAPQ